MNFTKTKFDAITRKVRKSLGFERRKGLEESLGGGQGSVYCHLSGPRSRLMFFSFLLAVLVCNWIPWTLWMLSLAEKVGRCVVLVALRPLRHCFSNSGRKTCFQAPQDQRTGKPTCTVCIPSLPHVQI